MNDIEWTWSNVPRWHIDNCDELIDDVSLFEVFRSK